MVDRTPRQPDQGSVEPLQSLPQHRSVAFIAQAPGDVNHAVGRDAHEVAVIGKMMDGAQRQPVDHCGDPPLVRILHDVSRLNELGLLERADGATMAIGGEHIATEAMLVQPVAHLYCPGATPWKKTIGTRAVCAARSARLSGWSIGPVR